MLIAARRVDFHLKGNALSRWKYRQVDRFVCASEAIRHMLLEDGVPTERAVTVYEGIDLDRAAAAPPAELRADFWLPHDAPLVGNVAALVPHKGQKHLIDAAALVIRKVPDARFIIAGEGELRSALERQIKDRHLEKHVFLAGFRPDVLSVHKAFDLFVMSSVTEGLGSSLLDAMACEKAIVATTAGGMPEAVVDRETGLLVPPRDHEAMARAIVALLTDERARRAMASAGFRRVRERFSVERMVQGHASRVRAQTHCERGSPRYGSFSAVSPGRQPECVREQSSKVTAAPFPENVTPRAIRVDGEPSGSTRLTAPRLAPVCASKIRS